jgi:hypothetical protein
LIFRIEFDDMVALGITRRRPDARGTIVIVAAAAAFASVPAAAPDFAVDTAAPALDAGNAALAHVSAAAAVILIDL